MRFVCSRPRLHASLSMCFMFMYEMSGRVLPSVRLSSLPWRAGARVGVKKLAKHALEEKCCRCIQNLGCHSYKTFVMRTEFDGRRKNSGSSFCVAVIVLKTHKLQPQPLQTFKTLPSASRSRLLCQVFLETLCWRWVCNVLTLCFQMIKSNACN